MYQAKVSSIIMKLFCKLSFHKWKYTDGDFTRECTRCDKYQITVGDEPSLYRKVGDRWVTTVEGE